MKTKPSLLLALTALALVSCDTTTRDNRPTKSSNSAYSYFNPNGSGFDTGTRSGASSDDPATDAGTATDVPTAATVPEDIKHCSWSFNGTTGYEKNHAHIGSYTLCKATGSDMDVYLQVKTPITDAQLCIIPTTSNGTKSTYIGEPRCLMVDTNNKVYKISLLKNRTGYGEYSMTGVMIMKDKAYYFPGPYYQKVLAPDAYMYCANMVSTANNTSYCKAFDQVGQYVYHTF